MQSFMFSVYDRRAQAYGRPFIMQNASMAIRAFLHACNDPATDVGMCPDDYSLRQIGNFDDEDGKITAHEPQIVCEGSSAKIPNDPTNTERN